MPNYKGFGLIPLIILITVSILAILAGTVYYYGFLKKPNTNSLNQSSISKTEEVQSELTKTSKAEITQEQIKQKSSHEIIQDAVLKISTNDKLWLSTFEGNDYDPGSSDEIEMAVIPRVFGRTFIDLKTKDYISEIKSTLIQRTEDNQKVQGNLDLELRYIDSIKKSYLKTTSNGKVAESWIEVDENNPPKGANSSRTDIVKNLIDDTINIYIKDSLSDAKQEESIDLKKKVDIIDGKVDILSIGSVFNQQYGRNGKYSFDFTKAEPKVKFSLDKGRIELIDLTFKSARVRNTTGEEIGSFTGRSTTVIKYLDANIPVQEIKIPDGKITKIEEVLGANP